MKELIAALESATGPDRELDAQIWWAVQRKAAERCYWAAAVGEPRDLGSEMPRGLGFIAVKEYSPAFTRSIDAVTALIEDGVEWSVTNLYGVAHAEVGLNFADRDFEVSRRKDGNVILALLTAALKARNQCAESSSQ